MLKMKRNAGLSPTMSVISRRGVTGLVVKLVDKDIVELD